MTAAPEDTDDPGDDPGDDPAVRDAVAAAVPGPTDAERERMDTAVFAALAAHGGGTTDAGTSCEAAPVPLRPGSRRKPSPRARGKRAMPYFAAAAAIAIVLSVGISIVATTLKPGASTDSAALEFTVDEPDVADTAGTPLSDVPSDVPSAVGDGARTEESARTPAAGRSGTPGAEPALFLTNLTLRTEADLVGLAKRAPLATVTPEAARDELTSTAQGLPTVADLPACLATLPATFVPMRVETGTWQDAAVFFVSGSPVDGNVAVYAVARPTCALVTSISLD